MCSYTGNRRGMRLRGCLFKVRKHERIGKKKKNEKSLETFECVDGSLDPKKISASKDYDCARFTHVESFYTLNTNEKFLIQSASLPE